MPLSEAAPASLFIFTMSKNATALHLPGQHKAAMGREHKFAAKAGAMVNEV
jgi:hypothetical protein